MKSWISFFLLLFLCGCASKPHENAVLDIDSIELDRYWKATGDAILFKSTDLDSPMVDGEVNLTYTINAQGQVLDVIIVESLPSGVWDEFAIRAASQLSYRPSTTNLSLQSVRVSTTFSFKAM